METWISVEKTLGVFCKPALLTIRSEQTGKGVCWLIARQWKLVNHGNFNWISIEKTLGVYCKSATVSLMITYNKFCLYKYFSCHFFKFNNLIFKFNFIITSTSGDYEMIEVCLSVSPFVPFMCWRILNPPAFHVLKSFVNT